jgi:acetyltransferase-like isoleucine patch superfamily enzyme
MKIHPASDVQSEKIGHDTAVWQFTIILPGALIGRNCNINSHCFIENDVVIGDNVTVKCGVYIWDGITIEDDVHLGPNVTFTNDLYPRSKHSFELARTVVKRGASVGANSTVIAGVKIGEYALIGAGSVVTKSIPNNTLWMGNPARMKGYVCNCGYKLDQDFCCPTCKSVYKLVDEKIIKQ